MAEVLNRYGRQEIIEGWNQEKIKKFHLAIVGAGHTGNFLAASAAALGIGEIRIYDSSRIDNDIMGRAYYEREFLLTQAREMSSKVESLERRVRSINPLIRISGLHLDLDDYSESIVEKPNLMVIATNESESIRNYAGYCNRKRVPLYQVLSNEQGALFTRGVEMNREYLDKEQDAITSEVISGMLIGEIAKFIMDGGGIETLSYYPSGNRFHEPRKISRGDLSDKKALVIGAGALGNFLGIGLAHAGLGRMYLIDDDDIEITNLNRQILFYDSVGLMKAEVLGKRLMEINPGMKVEPIIRRVDENFEKDLKKMKPDVIIDCVDNLATRAILNQFALRHGIPLVSGGTNYQAGQVVVFEPGKSSCLDCRLGVDKAFVEARRSSSCIHAPTPSVVVTNHIIGGMMANEVRAVLDSKHYGEAVRQTIKYDSTKPARVGLIGTIKECKCKRDYSAKEWVSGLLRKKNSNEKVESEEESGSNGEREELGEEVKKKVQKEQKEVREETGKDTKEKEREEEGLGQEGLSPLRPLQYDIPPYAIRHNEESVPRKKYMESGFNIRGHHRYDLRGWIRENFPFVESYKERENPENLAVIESRANEIVNACREVKERDIRAKSSYIDYYSKDWDNIEKTYNENDWKGLAENLEKLLYGIDYE